MDFESRRLLLLHQSATTYRRGHHSLYRACTTSHRVCTAAGNDCVTCSEDQNSMYRHSARWSNPVTSNAILKQKRISFNKILPNPSQMFLYCVCILLIFCQSPFVFKVGGENYQKRPSCRAIWIDNKHFSQIKQLLCALMK